MGAAFLLPAVATALNYGNQQQANSRSNSTLASGIGQQSSLRSQAMGGVNQMTQTIANDNPAQLQDAATQKYIQNLRSNIGSAQQPGIESSLSTQAGANPRYAKAESAANQGTQNYGDALAQAKGATDAAVRLRQNEGLGMGTLATQLQGLNQNSQGDYYANQIAAKTAGTQNPWVMAAASALKGYGNALSQNPNPATSWNNGMPYVNPTNGQLNYDPGPST